MLSFKQPCFVVPVVPINGNRHVLATWCRAWVLLGTACTVLCFLTSVLVSLWRALGQKQDLVQEAQLSDLEWSSQWLLFPPPASVEHCQNNMMKSWILLLPFSFFFFNQFPKDVRLMWPYSAHCCCAFLLQECQRQGFKCKVDNLEKQTAKW